MIRLDVPYADFTMALRTNMFGKRLSLLLRLAGNLPYLVGCMTVRTSVYGLSSASRFSVNTRRKMLELIAIMTVDAIYGSDFRFVREIRRIESFVAGNALQIPVGRYGKRPRIDKKGKGSPQFGHRKRSIAVASEAFGTRLRKCCLYSQEAERQ